MLLTDPAWHCIKILLADQYAFYFFALHFTMLVFDIDRKLVFRQVLVFFSKCSYKILDRFYFYFILKLNVQNRAKEGLKEHE